MTTETPKPGPASERPKGLVFRAPDDAENLAPALANVVAVSGATDALILEFFFASQSARVRAYTGEFGGAVQRGADGTAVIVSEPVARVALPISVAIDMMVDSIRVALEEAPAIKERFEQAMREVQEVIAASPLTKK